MHLGLVVLALIASACSSSGTAAVAATPNNPTPAQECFLGLDLWDSDPALTWIEDGRVWVRAGDRHACLAFTDASHLWWSPDGRRLFLDDQVVKGDDVLGSPPTVDARQVIWQQPLGEAVHILGDDGLITSHSLVVDEVRPASLPADAVMLASHPDGKHYAAIDRLGSVSLFAPETGDAAMVLALAAEESPVQMEFSPDGSRLWVLVASDSGSRALFVDLVPVSDFLDIPPVVSMVPSSVPEMPIPDLFYLDVDLVPDRLDLAVGVGATGSESTRFVLHPTHPDWIVLSEGRCAAATSALFIGGTVKSENIPGAAVGFFRGGGLPILATTTAGGDCGQGQLWVTSGLPLTNSPVLIAEDIEAADIRDEAPDPWNPNTAPPFA